MIYCDNCHKTFESQTQFCTNCGWRITGNPAAPEIKAPLVNSAEVSNSGASSSNSRNMLYFTIMVVAVSITAVVVAISFTRSNSSKSSSSNGASSAAPESSQSASIPEPDSTNYVAEMNLLLTEYSSSRTALSKFVSRIDADENVSVEEAKSFFDNATNQRQSILDQMNSLVPPPNLAGNHGEIVSLISRAITAMNSANVGIAACDYGVGDCQIGSIPAWKEFRSESKKITPLYNKALNAWKSAAGVS